MKFSNPRKWQMRRAGLGIMMRLSFQQERLFDFDVTSY